MSRHPYADAAAHLDEAQLRTVLAALDEAAEHRADRGNSPCAACEAEYGGLYCDHTGDLIKADRYATVALQLREEAADWLSGGCPSLTGRTRCPTSAGCGRWIASSGTGAPLTASSSSRGGRQGLPVRDPAGRLPRPPRPRAPPGQARPHRAAARPPGQAQG
jgi:hypothetical protein